MYILNLEEPSLRFSGTATVSFSVFSSLNTPSGGGTQIPPCDTITKESLVKHLTPNEPQYALISDTDKWELLCFNRKTGEFTIRFLETQVEVVLKTADFDSQTQNSYPFIPAAASATINTNAYGRSGPGITDIRGKPFTNATIGISQETLLILIANRVSSQTIYGYLSSLDKSQWQIKSFDRNKRKAELRVQNRMITVDV